MDRPGLLDPRIVAVLGPTNTGKTHFAVERMLGHASGMIGFPLRLLAREVYDRVVAIKGPARTALVTGEEKLGPEDAPYVIATVEAMPIHRHFAFIAIDEIQLCADHDRGHVFTDRLLNTRGFAETMFLGSDTMRPLIQQLVPDVDIITRPRLSVLTHTGRTKLTRLPRRSAVVAFTAADVYKLAEFVRRQKGGAAVVLGALSPRTRNAQVEMYQSGEVEHLVATDAIGMGLNMDLTHVAFAQLRKFDGRDRRPLTAAEAAQIAGRAGRHMANGTFGTTHSSEPFDEKMIEAIEAHHFAPIKELRWRNGDLDFSSLDALSESLGRGPHAASLIKVRDALDDRSLGLLGKRPEIRERATRPASVRRLWDVCQIPDFRHTLTDAHLHLLARVFQHITHGNGVIPADWVADRIASLERMDGDIETLVNRIAHVRTWTYLSHRREWFDDARHWQERAREVEDRLSDALHERLTQRFVDRRAAALMRALRENGEVAAQIDEGGEVFVDGILAGKLEGFTFAPVESDVDIERKLLFAVARKCVSRAMIDRLKALKKARGDELSLAADGITWQGAVIGKLKFSGNRLRPRIVAHHSGELCDQAARQLLSFLQDWLAKWLSARLAPLLALERFCQDEQSDGAARGIAFRLLEGWGNISAKEFQAQSRLVGAPARKKLNTLGVRFGVQHLFIPKLLKPSAQQARALLLALESEASAPAEITGQTVLRSVADWPAGLLEHMGFYRLGDLALRVDVAERLAAKLRLVTRARASLPMDPSLAAEAGLRLSELQAILPLLGFQQRKQGDEVVLARTPVQRKFRKQQEKIRPKVTPPDPSSPFAALAVLKHG